MKLLAVFVMLACNICKSTTGVFEYKYTLCHHPKYLTISEVKLKYQSNKNKHQGKTISSTHI